MIFPVPTAFLLGLAALTAAAPHSYARFENKLALREAGSPAARGLRWTPRSLYPRAGRDQNNVALDITIDQFSDQVIHSDSKSKDIELVQIVQERLIIIDNSRQFADNVRKNTFRNKNSKVNTIVIIVTQIVDQRKSNSTNTRYLTRQLQSNQSIKEQEIVVISESKQFTVGADSANSIPTGVSGAATAGPTGSVQQFGTYSPNASAVFQGDNAQNLLPSGAAAPSWPNAQVSQDPAEILLENPSQGVFVQFVNEDNSNSNDAAIIIVSA